MALDFSINSHTVKGRYLALTCHQRPVIEENKSYIDWTLTVTGGEVNYYQTGPTTVTIGGVTACYYGKVVYGGQPYPTDLFPAGYTGLSRSGTIEIPHDSYGSRAVTVSIETAIYNGVLKTQSGEWTLDTIARASHPTLSASRADMGTDLLIYTNRATSSFTHTLKYTFAEKTATIATNVGDSYKWRIPYDLAKEIPSDPAGICTITCETYNGSVLIGSEPVSFTAVVPNNETTRPRVSIALSAVNDLPSAFNGLYIQGISQVRVNITATSVYSQIASYSASGAGSSASGNPALFTVLEYGDKEITATVTDARGFSNSAKATISVCPYELPYIAKHSGQNSVICERCDANGSLNSSGVYLRIMAGRGYSPVVSGGVQKNFCSLQYQYKANGGQYSNWVDLIPGNNLATNETNRIITDIFLDSTTPYTVQIRAIDDIGRHRGKYGIAPYAIPTAEVAFHLKEGGNGAAFGGYATAEKTLHLAPGWVLKIGDTTLSEEQLKRLLP